MTEANDFTKEEAKLREAGDASAIAIRGRSFLITEKEIEQMTIKYSLRGDELPEEAAIKHLIERKALLSKAVKRGYSVTEEELDKQIEETKEALKNSDDNQAYIDKIKEYGGEDEYWASIRVTTRDTMLINHYLDDEREKFARTQNSRSISVQAGDNTSEGWNKKKAEIIESLIDQEHIKILSDKYKDLSLLDQ